MPPGSIRGRRRKRKISYAKPSYAFWRSRVSLVKAATSTIYSLPCWKGQFVLAASRLLKYPRPSHRTVEFRRC